MEMAALLRKILLIDLLKGLKVTFRYQDPKEIYTEQYPLQRPQVAERYRGAPRLARYVRVQFGQKWTFGFRASTQDSMMAS